jgi:hypothetical protein
VSLAAHFFPDRRKPKLKEILKDLPVKVEGDPAAPSTPLVPIDWATQVLTRDYDPVLRAHCRLDRKG